MQDLPPLGETGSEISHVITEPRNFAEGTKFSEDIKKTWRKENQKENKNIINNQTFLVQEPEKGETVTPCMDVCKGKIKSYGSLDTLKLTIVVRVDLQNKELVEYIWSPTASMSNLKYFLVDAAKHKARVQRLYFIGAILKEKFNNRVFVKLDSRYADYSTEYSNYFGRSLILSNLMYGMTNYGKLFTDELTEWLLEAGFIQYQYQMSIYYNYALDGRNIVVLSYVDDCVYWYTSEALGNGLWML